jgi:cell division protein FtsQ
MTLRRLVRRLKIDVATRLRSVVLTGATVVGALWLVHFFYFEIRPAVVQHPYFQLAAIRIRCDSDALSPEQIAFRAGLFAGTSLWQLDTHAAEAVLEEPPWVERARVSRHFPNRVTIEVSERRPIAATPTPGGPQLIDANGVVFRPAGSIEYPDVPYLTGWQAASEASERLLRLRRLLAVARAAETRGLTISQVDVDGDGTLWMFPEGRRVAIRLGRGADLERKLARLAVVLDRIPADDAVVREIDASYTDRIAVRTREGAFTHLATALAQVPVENSGSGDRG